MIYRTDTHRPTETSVATEEVASLTDVALACASVALFLAGVAALLYVLHVLWGWYEGPSNSPVWSSGRQVQASDCHKH